MFGLFDDTDDTTGLPPGIEIERGPLREDKVFVDSDEIYWIGIHLDRAHAALGDALATHRDLERHRQDYCDEGDVAELDTATMAALTNIEKAWRAICGVTDAHEAQLGDAMDAEDADALDNEDDDDPDDDRPLEVPPPTP